MEDNKIIELYLQRQETAIEETAKKYQKYCHSIAYNILFDKNDADESVEKELENKYLSELINNFLLTLPKTERKIFICRYWYLDSILSISNQFGFSESKIKSMLYRTRKKMKIFLEKEGAFDEI